jgi:hypothetical protein
VFENRFVSWQRNSKIWWGSSDLASQLGETFFHQPSSLPQLKMAPYVVFQSHSLTEPFFFGVVTFQKRFEFETFSDLDPEPIQIVWQGFCSFALFQITLSKIGKSNRVLRYQKRFLEFSWKEIWKNQLQHIGKKNLLFVKIYKKKSVCFVSFESEGSLESHVLKDRVWNPFLAEKNISDKIRPTGSAGIGLFMMAQQSQFFSLEQKQDKLHLTMGFSEEVSSCFHHLTLPALN